MKILKSILYLFDLFAAIFIAVGVPTSLIQFFVMASGIDIPEDTLYEISGCAGISVVAAVCAVYVKKKYGNIIGKAEKFRPAAAMAYTLLTVSLCKIIIEEIIGVLLCRIYPVEVLSSREIGWIDYIFAIIFAPIFEELLFRYSIFNLLKSRFSETAAMLIGAVVFAFSHGYGIQGFISCFAVAIVLTMIYRRTHNIRYCILSHIGCNLFVSIINIVQNSGAELFGMPLQFCMNGYNILHPVIVITAAAFCIYFFKTKNSEKSNV